MMRLRTIAVAAVTALSLTTTLAPAHAEEQAAWQPLETTAARTDNPLKGFMPFGQQLDHNATNSLHDGVVLPAAECGGQR